MFRSRPTPAADGAYSCPLPEDQFLSRLHSLPLVTSAWGQLGALYAGTKERNGLFRFTLGTAETGLGYVVSTVRPVMAKLEKPIGSLNDLACNQLDKLESTYPIITKPTEEVLKQTVENYNAAVKPITERVKPLTDRVGSAGRYGINQVAYARDYTLDTLDGVKSYGVEKVNGAKAFGLRQISGVTELGQRQATRLLDNQAGRIVAANVDRAIDLADRYVDMFLPPADGEDAVNHDDDCPYKPSNQELVANELASKALSLGNKVRRRGYARFAKQLGAARLRTAETLEKLSHSVNLIDYARTNIDGVRTKLQTVWVEVNKSPEESSEDATENEENLNNLTYERRAIATARHLTQRLKSNLAGVRGGLESTWTLLPLGVRARLERAQGLAHSLYQTFTARASTGLSGEDVAFVKSSLANLRSTIESALKWAPNTVAVTVHVDRREQFTKKSQSPVLRDGRS